MDQKIFQTAFEQIEQAPRAEIPGLVAELGRLQAVLLSRLASPPLPAPIAAPAPTPAKAPRILSAKEAGAMLGRSRWWIYKNRERLPRVPLDKDGKGSREGKRERFGYSEASIAKWIREHERAGR